MKIFTIELDREVYIVCDIEGFIIMTDEEWDLPTLLDTAVHIESDPIKCSDELLALQSRIAKAEPRMHEVSEDMYTEEDGLIGVVSMPANMIMLAKGDKQGPMLALMQCDGEYRQTFRDNGKPISLSTIKDSSDLIYEHPTKDLSITTKIISTSIH